MSARGKLLSGHGGRVSGDSSAGISGNDVR